MIRRICCGHWLGLALIVPAAAQTPPENQPPAEPVEFRVGRLLDVTRANQGRTAAEVVAAIFASLDEWSDGAAPQDDRTVIVVVYPD